MFVTLKTFSDKPADIVFNTDHVLRAMKDGSSVRIVTQDNYKGFQVVGTLENVTAILNGVAPTTERRVVTLPESDGSSAHG